MDFVSTHVKTSERSLLDADEQRENEGERNEEGGRERESDEGGSAGTWKGYRLELSILNHGEASERPSSQQNVAGNPNRSSLDHKLYTTLSVFIIDRLNESCSFSLSKSSARVEEWRNCFSRRTSWL